MSQVSVCLWFSEQAEESAKKSGRPVGSVMTIVFELGSQEFMALNGGPMFTFTPATSVIVKCETQKQIDILWERLSGNGGKEVQCGWLQDRFGLSWQIVPAKMGEWMKDPKRGGRVMAALLSMKKLDIATLEKA